MTDVDLNLLPALDALLAEASVTRAARRLNVSTSAMSRTLTRLRAATADPLLVRAGGVLVPTPHAAALRDRVHALNREARAVLGPAPTRLDLASVVATFTIRVGESFMETLAPLLLDAVIAAAPHVRLRFALKHNKDVGPIREGAIDLEVGVLGMAAPEIRVQTLFRDGFVGVVRAGHPLLDDAAVTAERYVAFGHVVASRKERFAGPVDDALAALGLRREVTAVVPGYPDAIRFARGSDLVALVPRSCLVAPGGTVGGVRAFDLPVRTPEVAIAAAWHPRMDNDPLHRWMRQTVAAVCRPFAQAR